MIQFRSPDRLTPPAEGMSLLNSAKAASSAMPWLLRIGRDLDVTEVNHTTSVLQEIMPEAGLRIMEGIAIPLCIARKVNYHCTLLTNSSEYLK